MVKTKTREITIKESKGAFAFVKDTKISKKAYNFEGLSALRQLLNNEKARILHAIKTHNPGSIYELSKILKRNFKSVIEDVKLLERFGFVEFTKEKTKNRVRHKPEVIVDNINIHIKI